MTLACDVKDSYDSYRERHKHGAAVPVYYGSSLASTGISLVKVSLDLTGYKSDFVSFLEVPTRLFKNTAQVVAAHEKNCDGSLRGRLRFFEQGIVAPAVDSLRLLAEYNRDAAQIELDLVTQDPNAQRPIWEDHREPGDEYPTWVLVGYEPINPEECRRIISEADAAAYNSAAIRVVATSRGGSGCVDQMYKLVNSFLYLRKHHNAVGCLRTLHTIPTRLYADTIFGTYVCPITGKPIRHPIADPDGVTIYEEEAIRGRINQGDNISQQTNSIITPWNLIPRPDIQQIIDDRLKEIEERISNVAITSYGLTNTYFQNGNLNYLRPNADVSALINQCLLIDAHLID